MELWRLTVQKAHELLKRREISAVELTRAVLDRIGQVESKVQAFLTITDDIALKMAEDADRRIKAGDAVTPLTGIPVAIKDNMCPSRRLDPQPVGAPTRRESLIAGRQSRRTNQSRGKFRIGVVALYKPFARAQSSSNATDT